MQTITTIGLDIAKSVFQFHGVVRRQLKDDIFWHSFRSCHHAWLASRPVHRRIIGRVNFKRLGTRSA
jgi:hypothetical protein